MNSKIQIIHCFDFMDKFEGVVGNLKHRLDVHLHFKVVDNRLDTRFFSAKARRDYVAKEVPSLLPFDRDPAGNEPGDSTVAHIFAREYATNAVFVEQYLKWLNEQQL